MINIKQIIKDIHNIEKKIWIFNLLPDELAKIYGLKNKQNIIFKTPLDIKIKENEYELKSEITNFIIYILRYIEWFGGGFSYLYGREWKKNPTHELIRKYIFTIESLPKLLGDFTYTKINKYFKTFHNIMDIEISIGVGGFSLASNLVNKYSKIISASGMMNDMNLLNKHNYFNIILECGRNPTRFINYNTKDIIKEILRFGDQN